MLFEEMDIIDDYGAAWMRKCFVLKRSIPEDGNKVMTGEEEDMAFILFQKFRTGSPEKMAFAGTGRAVDKYGGRFLAKTVTQKEKTFAISASRDEVIKRFGKIRGGNFARVFGWALECVFR